MTVLGIESSCDETGVAIVKEEKLLVNLVASQEEVHAPFGGVVPELASRRHLETIVPLVRGALEEANLSLAEIDGIAATSAPGLIGALLVGLSVAKGLAFALQKPFVGVNHLEAHLNAILLEEPKLPYPHIGLIVSGGHTSLYLVKAFGDYTLLGCTRDDAIGEAFDKVAKLMGLGFPGGPEIDRLAAQGNPEAYSFSMPRFQEGKTLDFSFSGIKTACRLQFEKGVNHADLAASFQRACVNFVISRLLTALEETKTKAMLICGGVAANRELRQRAYDAATKRSIACFIPSMKLCTDNAAMIACVGERYLRQGKRHPLTLNAIANQEIGEK